MHHIYPKNASYISKKCLIYPFTFQIVIILWGLCHSATGTHIIKLHFFQYVGRDTMTNEKWQFPEILNFLGLILKLKNRNIQ